MNELPDIPEVQDAIPDIAEVQRFRYAPGDRFILKLDFELYDQQQAHEIADHFRAALRLPEDVPVVVIDKFLAVEIVSPE